MRPIIEEEDVTRKMVIDFLDNFGEFPLTASSYYTYTREEGDRKEIELKIELVLQRVMELSEVISEGFADYCEEEGLDPESTECYKIWQNAYEEELEKNSVPPVNAHIKTRRYELTVEDKPLEKDYDWTGYIITVRVTDYNRMFIPEALGLAEQIINLHS